ncbi:FHA domain-containing protein [Frankia sp. CN7]|uniref:FHA domain-containing protein n=1 Tax=Frankia nepalensis TaxID=1836974 RepID=UPI0019336007|nr:FHA domain-containing protein [Frankia nepalensis]MBL7495971.1 FHA domain-containing protein [Frankia nepalensis]
MAGLDRFRVVVEAGRGHETGVVVRLPGVLIVARAGRPRTADTARRLLDLCAEVAAEPGDTASTGRRLVRRVAGLLAAADPDEVPDFTLLAAVGERIAALVHGAMDVTAAGPSPLTLSGEESATWVDRLLPDGITHVHVAPSGSLGMSGAPAEEAEITGTGLGFPLDLRIGAVPGIGVSLLPAREAALPVPKSAAEDLLANYGPPREPATAAERIPVPVERIPPPAERVAPVDRGPAPLERGPAPLDRGPAPLERIPEQQAVAPPALSPLLSKEEQEHRRQAGAEPTRAADFDELNELDEFDEDPPTELARPVPSANGQAVPLDAGELTEDDDSEALTQLPGQTFTVSDLIDDDAPTMLPSNDQAQVEGVLCPSGHFNHPQAPYCAECGASLSAHDSQPVWRPRPPVGVLVFDDGHTVPVDIDLVIGRQPDKDDAVRAGTARPLPVEDGESAVSRVHAVITLNGWDAVITDRGSANGTYIAPPEATVWTALEPHQPAPLVSGTRVQVGKRTFVFNSQVHV